MNTNPAYAKKAKNINLVKNQVAKNTRKLKTMTLSRRPKSAKAATATHLGEASYLQAIMAPECAHQCKVPGQATATVCLKRHITLNMQANALGALGIMWQPNTLFDNTQAALQGNLLVSGNNLEPTLLLNNTFDGVSTQGVRGPVCDQLTFSVSPSTVNQSRLVSASMHVVPQASLLNQQGSIHGALMTAPLISGVAPGTAYVGYSSLNLLSYFQNTPYYKEASISSQEGIRVLYVPDDPCLLDFSGINAYYSESGGSAQMPTMLATVVGAAASAAFRVDFFLNYEITAAPASIVQGMETIASENTVATTVWRDVVANHSNAVVTVSRALSNVPGLIYASLFKGATKSKPNFRPPKLYN